MSTSKVRKVLSRIVPILTTASLLSFAPGTVTPAKEVTPFAVTSASGTQICTAPYRAYVRLNLDRPGTVYYSVSTTQGGIKRRAGSTGEYELAHIKVFDTAIAYWSVTATTGIETIADGCTSNRGSG